LPLVPARPARRTDKGEGPADPTSRAARCSPKRLTEDRSGDCRGAAPPGQRTRSLKTGWETPLPLSKLDKPPRVALLVEVTVETSVEVVVDGGDGGCSVRDDAADWRSWTLQQRSPR